MYMQCVTSSFIHCTCTRHKCIQVIVYFNFLRGSWWHISANLLENDVDLLDIMSTCEKIMSTYQMLCLLVG